MSDETYARILQRHSASLARHARLLRDMGDERATEMQHAAAVAYVAQRLMIDEPS